PGRPLLQRRRACVSPSRVSVPDDEGRLFGGCRKHPNSLASNPTCGCDARETAASSSWVEVVIAVMDEATDWGNHPKSRVPRNEGRPTGCYMTCTQATTATCSA